MNTRNRPWRTICPLLPGAILFAVWISAGSAEAAVANVSVVNNAFQPAAITINPNDQVKWTWSAGDGGTPHSTTSDSPGLWDSGIRTEPFQFTMTFPSEGTFPYHCTVHQNLGMAGTVKVRAAGVATAPGITMQPASQTVSAGANVTFTVAATGSAPLSYQWRFNGAPMAGATRSSLVLRKVQSSNAGRYSVVVNNSAGSATSVDAALTVQSAGGTTNSMFTAASYNGLFFDPNGIARQSSGNFALTLNNRGKFTGVLQSGGGRFPLAGQFDANGSAQASINRRGQSALHVVLQSAPNDPDTLVGTVSDGTFTANLTGGRAVFDGRQHVAAQAGRYTMVIPGSANSAAAPGGDSFGTVTVDKAGRVRFSGSMADGTRVSQSVPISRNGAWPLYVPLYGGKGSLISWIVFAPTGTSDLGGDVAWMPGARVYPDGFTLRTTARGSAYQPGSNGAVLNFTNGQVTLTGGDLPAPVANSIVIGARNRVANLSGNKLVMTFAPATGLFSGRLVDPSSGTPVLFQGAVLQRENVARGWFLGTHQTGDVIVAGQ